MVCDIAVGGLKEMQHYSQTRGLLVSCSMFRTVRLACARVEGPSAQRHDLDREHVHDAHWPHSVQLWLTCQAAAAIALPAGGEISRFRELLMTPTGPHSLLWLSGRHMDVALHAFRFQLTTYMVCGIAAGAL